MDNIYLGKYLNYKGKYLKLSNQLGGNKCKKTSNIELLTTSPHIVSAPEEVCLDNKQRTKLGSIYPSDLDKPDNFDIPERLSFPKIIQLYERINEKFYIIIKEMEKGEKESCWAWWVFPNDKEGNLEPEPKTNVTIKDAHFLFKSKRFIFIHEKIYELFLRKKINKVEHYKIQNIFPKVDHRRIHFFIEFWKQKINDKPEWFDDYLSVLEKYY